MEAANARRNFSNLLSIGTGVSSLSSGVRLNGLGANGTRITVDGTNATGNSRGSPAQKSTMPRLWASAIA